MIGVPLMTREQDGGINAPKKARRKKYAGNGTPKMVCPKWYAQKSTVERREKQDLPAISVSDVQAATARRRLTNIFRPLSRCRTAQIVLPKNINLTSLRQRIIFSAVAPTFHPILH
jgi:hypothetical protein